jgi:hypothetical protein
MDLFTICGTLPSLKWSDYDSTEFGSHITSRKALHFVGAKRERCWESEGEVKVLSFHLLCSWELWTKDGLPQHKQELKLDNGQENPKVQTSDLGFTFCVQGISVKIFSSKWNLSKK